MDEKIRGRLLQPVDWLFSGYNLILAGLWATAGATWMVVLHMVVLHLVAAGLPWVIRRLARASAAALVVADFYPFVAVPFVWGELGTILPLLHAHPFDAEALRFDAWALGGHWHARWMAAAPTRWISEPMYAAYASFYLLLGVPPLVMLATGRRRDLRVLGSRLLLVYVVCALCNFVWPVVGPTPVLPAHSAIAHGFFFRLTTFLQQAGDSLGTSFPSTHVAAAVTVACCAWTWSTPVLAALISVDAVAITFATVYTQAHYGIDAVAGVIVAIVLQLAIVAVSSTTADRPTVPDDRSRSRRRVRRRPAARPPTATPARRDR
jgi:membrane-associated phospholipid phosphatase